jgi:hypothetical protein
MTRRVIICVCTQCDNKIIEEEEWNIRPLNPTDRKKERQSGEGPEGDRRSL